MKSQDFFVALRIIKYKIMKADMMAVHQIQSLGAKQDILRDVVIKYIDHFYPE